jgi:hypothetical protein
MAIGGLVNLFDGAAVQQFGQAHSYNGVNPEQSSHTQIQKSVAPAPNTGDRYTPSGGSNSTVASAQAAGLFQITEFIQIGSPNASASQQPVASQSVQDVTLAQSPAAPNPATAVAVTQPNAVSTPAPPPIIANAASASQEIELQALNTALSDLGLNSAQLSRVDQIASSVIQNFSPAAYSEFVYQRQVQ